MVSASEVDVAQALATPELIELQIRTISRLLTNGCAINYLTQALFLDPGSPQHQYEYCEIKTKHR